MTTASPSYTVIRTVPLMDAASLRANLVVSGSVSIETTKGVVEVRIVPPERLHAGTPSPFYTPLWIVRSVRSGLSRVWRWLRRDRRWFVLVVPAGAGNREGEIRAEARSRPEALDKAVKVAEQLMSAT